jgi:hypothetical protein
MTSYDGFQWPTKGPVVAPDWNPAPVCGGGLHGLLRGCGEAYLLNWSEDAKWVVFSAYEDEVVDLYGKVKVPRGEVVLCGTKEEALEFLEREYPEAPIVGSTVVTRDHGTANAGDRGTANAGTYGTANAGDYGTANAGDRGTANAGHCGRANAGDCGTANAGTYGRATAGDCGTANAGTYGTANAGDYGTATAEYCGIATAGDYGTANAGDRGTATAEYYGIATVGDRGTATAGDYGTANAGDYGIANAGRYGKAVAGKDGRIQIEYYDSDSSRYRVAIGYIGEDRLKPDVLYKLDENHKFVEVQNQEGDSDETKE